MQLFRKIGLVTTVVASGFFVSLIYVSGFWYVLPGMVFGQNDFSNSDFLNNINNLNNFNSQTNTMETSNTVNGIFLRDLKEGDKGVDVSELQRILNRDVITQVAQTGDGSPGLETTFFGPATKNAVIRFQNKYAARVLYPAGLTEGTGVVGQWTRFFLNEIVTKFGGNPPGVAVFDDPKSFGDGSEPTPDSVLPRATINPSFGSSSGPNSLSSLSGLSGSGANANTNAELTLAFSSTQAAGAGSSVTLSGTGFSSDSNSVRFNGIEVAKDLAVSTGGQISFSIPISIVPGRYDITVKNGKGKTSNSLSFMVTVPGAVKPVVENIAPTSVKFGEKITITGQNFAPTGNIVSTDWGVFKDIPSSDGKTLVLTIPLPSYISESKSFIGNTDNMSWPVRIHVINRNGISESVSAAEFTIKI